MCTEHKQHIKVFNAQNIAHDMRAIMSDSVCSGGEQHTFVAYLTQLAL